MKGNNLDICANLAVCLESEGVELHTWGKETEGNTYLIFFLGAMVPEHSHDMLWQPPDLSTQAPLGVVEVHLPGPWKKQTCTQG